MKTILYDLSPLDTLSRVRGIGRYVRELARGLGRLAKQADDVRIVGLVRVNWDGSYRITHDVGSFEGSPDVPKPDQADYYRWAYRRRLALFRAVRSIGADVVHLGDPNATPLFWSLSGGCKRIVTCHDLIPSRYPHLYFSYKDGGPVVGAMIARRRYATADLVVAISQATADDLVHIAKIPRERIVRVYNGVDVERWGAPSNAKPAEVAARYGLTKPFVLYVGDGDWRKNVEGMVAGLARARAQGIDVELAWAGKLSPARLESFERHAREAGVADAARALGYVPDDDLRELYRAARAHLFVSRAEGFGLTVVEAMAAGCPVITTKAGSLGEVGGEAALTVDPEDHAAIGEAIARLCRDDGLRDELIARGKERAPQFSIDVQARAMLDVYRRVAFGKA